MSSWRVGLLAIVSSFAIGCGGSASYNSPTVALTAPTPAISTGPASPMTISIPSGAATLGVNAFSPSPLTVAPGTTVTWTNADVVAHTSTSDVSGWDSGTLAPGQPFMFTFSTSGTFHYHCAIHPGMVGTVIVP
jgi:plastocyanin